jgi:hydroxymethylglutaryl-CoA synthase
MEQKFEKTLYQNAVDFTFACIGGVDAMQNCIDYVTLNQTKKAIVVTTDLAKYDLNSTGEYTRCWSTCYAHHCKSKHHSI